MGLGMSVTRDFYEKISHLHSPKVQGLKVEPSAG